MKQSVPNRNTPLWLKRIFLSIALVVAILMLAVIPMVTYGLVKQSLVIIDGPDSVDGHALPGLLGFVTFGCYVFSGFMTEVFGLLDGRNWQ